MRTRILALALACVSVLPAAAQISAPLDFAAPANSPAETISRDIEEVRLVLTVADRRGHFIKGLSPKDVAIFDDGRSVERLTFFGTESALPLRLAVLVDISGSMAAEFGFERKVAEDFFKRVVGPQDSAELIAFHVQSFNIGRGHAGDEQLKRIRKQSLRAGTAIWDAVRSACRQLDSHPDERSRKALLLITDGEDNSSHIGLEEAIEAAWQDEVTVFVADVNRFHPTPELTRLAVETGGQKWAGGNAANVVSAFQHLQDSLRSQYVLAYRVPEAQDDGRFHPVKVVPSNKKFRALCRRGYYALRRKLPATE